MLVESPILVVEFLIFGCAYLFSVGEFINPLNCDSQPADLLEWTQPADLMFQDLLKCVQEWKTCYWKDEMGM